MQRQKLISYTPLTIFSLPQQKTFFFWLFCLVFIDPIQEKLPKLPLSLLLVSFLSTVTQL
jgi:hypothetical protein